MKKKIKKDNSLFEYYGFTKRDAKKGGWPYFPSVNQNPTIETLQKIAKALDVSVEDLLQ